MDYASPAALTQKLDGYFLQAQKNGWLQRATIAVLPEYTGTWLVASGEKKAVFDAEDVSLAMTTLALTHLPSFAYYMITAPAVQDRAKWALFTSKAERMSEDYQTVFGGLAQRYGVHLVAGSIVLPDPHLENGQLVVRPGGPLYNISALFGPDGRIVPPLVFKAYPIEDENRFLAAGKPQDIPVFQTPAGKLAVLICADAWYPSTYAAVQAKGAQLIAIPSFSAGDGMWASAWSGYNGAATPTDVDQRDVGKLTEGQAWQKYAMGGRAAAHGMQQGVNVFLRGALWNLGSDGATLALREGQQSVSPLTNSAALTSVWLP
jgi:predicted amidohydrolase